MVSLIRPYIHSIPYGLYLLVLIELVDFIVFYNSMLEYKTMNGNHRCIYDENQGCVTIIFKIVTILIFIFIFSSLRLVGTHVYCL